jgi:hypothetical protein
VALAIRASLGDSAWQTSSSVSSKSGSFTMPNLQTTDLVILEIAGYANQAGSDAFNVSSAPTTAGQTWNTISNGVDTNYAKKTINTYYMRPSSNLTAPTVSATVSNFYGSVSPTMGICFGGWIITGFDTTTPIGKKLSPLTQVTTNNATVGALAGYEWKPNRKNSWMYVAAYDSRNLAPDGSDNLTVRARTNTTGVLSGYRDASNPFSPITTASINANGTGAAEWQYTIFEIYNSDSFAYHSVGQMNY